MLSVKLLMPTKPNQVEVANQTELNLNDINLKC